MIPNDGVKSMIAWSDFDLFMFNLWFFLGFRGLRFAFAGPPRKIALVVVVVERPLQKDIHIKQFVFRILGPKAISMYLC